MDHVWERVFVGEGGTVLDFAVTVPAGGVPVVYAATLAGLFRSRDRGATWRRCGSRSGPAFIETVTLAPDLAQTPTIFVGTNAGCHRSDDGGETWRELLSGSRVQAIAVSPDLTQDGLVLLGTEHNGIIRSDDGGSTWSDASAGLLEQSVLDLSLSPDFQEDQTCYAATAAGLFRSRNGGKSWRVLTFDDDEIAVQAVIVSTTRGAGRLVLAGTESRGLWKSHDDGKSWEEVPALSRRTIVDVTFTPIKDRETAITVTSETGIVVSLDGGDTWHGASQTSSPPLTAITLPSEGGQTLIAGLVDEGIARSDDAGHNWTVVSQEINARLLTGLTASPTFADDHTLFAVDLERGILRSEDAGATWSASHSGLDDDMVSMIATSPTAGDRWTLYAATGSGIYRSQNRGATWQRCSRASDTFNTGALAVAPASNSESEVIFTALSDGTLLQGNADGEWRSLGRPFDQAAVLSLAVSPGFPGDRTVWAVTRLASRDRQLAGTRLWCSRNGGTSWTPWLDADDQVALPVVIPASFAATGSVFAGIGDRLFRPIRRAQAVRGSETRPIWRQVAVAPPSASTIALAASPSFHDDATLFVATNTGIVVTRDGGETFTPLDPESGPQRPIALVVSPGYQHDRLVYVVALGGEIWRFCDR